MYGCYCDDAGNRHGSEKLNGLFACCPNKNEGYMVNSSEVACCPSDGYTVVSMVKGAPDPLTEGCCSTEYEDNGFSPVAYWNGSGVSCCKSSEIHEISNFVYGCCDTSKYDIVQNYVTGNSSSFYQQCCPKGSVAAIDGNCCGKDDDVVNNYVDTNIIGKTCCPKGSVAAVDGSCCSGNSKLVNRYVGSSIVGKACCEVYPDSGDYFTNYTVVGYVNGQCCGGYTTMNGLYTDNGTQRGYYSTQTYTASNGCCENSSVTKYYDDWYEGGCTKVLSTTGCDGVPRTEESPC